MGDMRACDSPTSNSPELSTMSSMNSRRIVESAGSASPTSGTTLGTITLAAGGLSTSNAKSSSSEQQRQQHPDGSEVDGKEYEMDTDQPGAKRRRVEQEQQISS